MSGAMKRFIPVLAVLLAVATLGATAVLAAPGGNGKGNAHGVTNGNGGKPLAATLTVEPSNPLSAWGQGYTVRGFGLEPNTSVSITMADPGCCVGFRVWTDGDGNLSFSRTTGKPGTYTVDAYQVKGHRFVLKATVSFIVE